MEDHKLQEILEKENLDLEGFLKQGTMEGVDSLPPEEYNKVQQLLLWKTETTGLEKQWTYKRNRPFIFENIWLSHPDFANNIAIWWAEELSIQGTSMFLPQKKLKHIKLKLKEWNKKEFGNIFERKKYVEGKFQEVNQTLIREGFDKESYLDREQSIRVISRHIPKLVSNEDNFNLNRPVSEDEISEVLKEMQNSNASGPDGFNVDYFNACWNIVKQDVLNVMEDSRRNKTIMKALNTTFIALIPKQDSTLIPDRFRPISLCNVVYKIISKVVANRLKLLLPTLVSGKQSRYVEGKQILDNIIQSHEVVHSLTSKRKARMIM
eukprot:PITA_07713